MAVILVAVEGTKRSWDALEIALKDHVLGRGMGNQFVIVHAQPFPYGLEPPVKPEFEDICAVERARLTMQSQRILRKAEQVCLKTIEELELQGRVPHGTPGDLSFDFAEGDRLAVLASFHQEHNPGKFCIGLSKSGGFSSECTRTFHSPNCLAVEAYYAGV